MSYWDWILHGRKGITVNLITLEASDYDRRAGDEIFQ
jgi:hypothetical protein